MLDRGTGEFDESRAREVIAGLAHLDGAMLPVLHALQATFGFLDRRCVALVANALNVSQAEVHGVITFYHDFRQECAGRHVLKICRAESCQATGAEDLLRHLKHVHKLSPGDTSPGQELTVESVYCLGHCAASPACLFDDEPVGRLDAEHLDRLVAVAGAGGA